MRKIIFANRKGGSGKTSIVVNLAYVLSKKRKKVLVIDLDSQAHSTFYLNKEFEVKYSILDVLKDNSKINDVIVETNYKNLFLLPAVEDLGNLNDKLKNKTDFLKNSIDKIDINFDFILIDIPPSLERIVISGLIAADEVMIPLQTHFFPMKGIAQLISLIMKINKDWNKDLKLSGIIPTLYNQRTKIYKSVISEIEDSFGKDILLPGIPYDIRMAEAPSFREPISIFAPNSRASKAFEILANKIIRMK